MGLIASEDLSSADISKLVPFKESRVQMLKEVQEVAKRRKKYLKSKHQVSV
jgi:hypothetical protein